MKTAAEIMDADVPSVTPADDARAAIDLLAKTELGAVTVVDADRKVVGIVSEADPIVAHTYEAADRVAKKIADHHHNHLPVVDEDGRLAGMVTRADALAAVVDG
jgi:CBS domain-containing protein